MTTPGTGWRTSALARWLTRAPLLLSRRLWAFPLVGAVVLSLVGFWSRSRVEEATRAELASRLQTLLHADVAALRLWFSEQQADAKALAADLRIQGAIAELVNQARSSNGSPELLRQAEAAHNLALSLRPVLEAQHYADYVVIGPERRILASPHHVLVGRMAPPGYEWFLKRALLGQVAISRPMAREASPSQRAEGPTMFVAAPVKSTNGQVIAVLALRIKPEAEFSQIFSLAHMGQTGEAYAFDRRGLMLTASRFDPELKQLGLIPKDPEATSILNLRLIDPGRELLPSQAEPTPALTQPEPPPQHPEPPPPGRPLHPRHDRPLTRMATAAVRGDDGVDVLGYRNYRGIRVVGAWAWLPEYDMGVATEVAVAEAFQTFYMLRQAFVVLFILLVLSGVAIFAFTLLVERLQASVRKTALNARRLGQYVLVQEIARGAHGRVYRARHSVLRRPVAIKLLSPEMTNENSAARFEHEVQMTSQLSHPNTVAIYDYGRTPEGLFYYAMEFLSGIDLDQLVRQFGPQPEGRVIHILRQVCGSLAEAHHIGLTHRDIKPANIVLTRRGGVCDVVKVLDFGLVKTGRSGPNDTTTQAVVGTPHFMAPEAVASPDQVDARSDLYAVGAVGYWLLTGKTLFEGDRVDALLTQQVQEMPLPPAQRLGKPVPEDLAALLMACLAKNPAERPANAQALDLALARCHSAGHWTAEQGELWWKQHLVGIEAMPAPNMAEKTLIIGSRS